VIRVLVVDDEPLAREGIKVRLEREPDVELVGEAMDGPEAVSAILSLRPDLVFLDVQMPGMDGFEVVERVAEVHLPVIVFATAYDEYALRAFEVHALDYLLKPVTARRFEEALRRARSEVARGAERETHRRLVQLLDAWRAAAGAGGNGGNGDAGGSIAELPSAAGAAVGAGDPPPLGLAPAGSSSPYLTRLVVRDGERFLLLRSEEVDWVESAANYVRVHARGASFLVRITMTELERRLDPARFTRIHRSTIVNTDRIREIRPEWHGDFDVVLTNGKSLRLSRSYRDRLLP